MPKSQSQADTFKRWAKLDYLLSRGGIGRRGWRIRGLAERLGVRPETVMRDLEQFEKFADDWLEVHLERHSTAKLYRYEREDHSLFSHFIPRQEWFRVWLLELEERKQRKGKHRPITPESMELRQAHIAGLKPREYRLLKLLSKGKPEKSTADIKLRLGMKPDQNFNGKFWAALHKLGEERYLESEAVEGERSLYHSITAKGRALIEKAIAKS